jgi:hypothetical protein
MFSTPDAGGMDAPGLNEKAGRAGDREAGLLPSTLAVGPEFRGSIAECGRLPVALEKEDGAEEDDGRGGKTNGGFGGGGCDRGDACTFEGCTCWDAISPIVGVPSGAPGSKQSGEGGSIIKSGLTVVAIFPSRSAAPDSNGNLVQRE